jgi:hypothetical protein
MQIDSPDLLDELLSAFRRKSSGLFSISLAVLSSERVAAEHAAAGRHAPDGSQRALA